MITSIELPLLDSGGSAAGSLEIACLPRSREIEGLPPLLADHRKSHDNDPITAPAQVLEEAEYRFLVDTQHEAVHLEPADLFEPSRPDGLEGRLRPGRSTGTIDVTVQTPDGYLIGRCELEVRSRKLDYLSEYRWMLEGIASEATELLQRRFAPTNLQAFTPSTTGDSRTTYQQFAFLRALLESEEFRGSLSLILNRPHHEYRPVETEIHPGHGMRTGQRLAQQLTQPGRRFHLPEGRRIAGLTTLPEVVTRADHAETVDTTPNRFVRFALEQWTALADAVRNATAQQRDAAERRGFREATQLREDLDRYRSAPLFTAVSPLTEFPAANQVLQRQAGYRDVFRAFFQAEAATLLDWTGGQDVFSAGQRDVATLYEYWVYLELARIIGDLDDMTLDRRELLKVTNHDLSLDLRKGTGRRLIGRGIRRGRKITIELWFNRSFGPTSDSWSERLRPDCSVLIRPSDGIAPDTSTWLHFDAKYRIDRYTELFADASTSDDESIEDEATDDALANESPAATSRPPADTILKMHAYRDAIRRSSGAYALYPGTDPEPLARREYHEILPGVGAFVLRPVEDGHADHGSTRILRTFLEDVLDHVAADGTSQERSDYWTQKAYQGSPTVRLDPEPALRRPPADTQVLLGYVKSPEHWNWIHESGLYNLRADDRRGSVGLDSPELAATLVLLYTNVPDERCELWRLGPGFFLKSAEDLSFLGYPEARSQRYCCLELAQRVTPASPIDAGHVRELARRGHARSDWGAPTVVTWLELDSFLAGVPG